MQHICPIFMLLSASAGLWLSTIVILAPRSVPDGSGTIQPFYLLLNLFRVCRVWFLWLFDVIVDYFTSCVWRGEFDHVWHNNVPALYVNH